jgi:tetratricopeptide (TPR) repeat protein
LRIAGFIAHQHKQIGVCERELGNYSAALRCFEESIWRAQEIGNRATLGYALCEQAEARLVQWYAAVINGELSQFSREVIEQVRQQLAEAQRLGSEIGNPELQHHVAVLLALTSMHDPQCPPEKATEYLRVLENTREQTQADPAVFRFETRLLSAICAINDERFLPAADMFTRAITELGALLETEPQFVRAREGLGLAYTGLALCQSRHRKKGSGIHEKELAMQHYCAARNLTSAGGTTTRALFWYDAMRHEQRHQEIRLSCSGRL